MARQQPDTLSPDGCPDTPAAQVAGTGNERHVSMGSALGLLIDNGGRAAVIWLVLVLLAVIALGALALPHGVRRPRQISAWLEAGARRKREELDRKRSEAQETLRYAEEIAVAARGAATTAERRRQECQQ